MNCINLIIKKDGFDGVYKGNVIFSKSGIDCDPDTMGFIALCVAFKYKKEKILFKVISNKRSIEMFRSESPKANGKLGSILKQCVEFRDTLNVNSFGLVKYME